MQADPRLPLVPAELKSAIHAVAGALLAGIFIAVLLINFAAMPLEGGLSRFFLLRQDGYLAAAMIAIFLILARLKTNAPGADGGNFRFSPLAAAAALFVFAYAGHYFLLGGYDLSRDEQLANFDAYIFSHGRLAFPVAEEWREHAAPLNIMFLLPIAGDQSFVSAYLPVNAATRALIGAVLDPAITSPLFIAIGAIALWGIARRLWPDQRLAAILALALYAGSGQILFNGMTSYAMSGHLALNLVWLWLYLQRRPLADVSALAVGFFATGLHQPLFHPLFAFPLLCLTLVRREWARAFLFAGGYALIGAFWLYWPHFVSAAAGGANAQATIDFLARLNAVFASLRFSAFEHMLLNVIRFATWQHVLFAPLLLLGLAAAWRGGAFERALAASALAPIPVFCVVLAYQGHGWGYRYEHAALGPAILLAVYGAQRLAAGGADMRRLVAIASFLTFAVLTPIQAVKMRNLYHTYAELDRMIETSAADFAVIEIADTPFASDLVLNRPDLSNRPIRLIAELTEPADFQRLCADGARIRFFDAASLAPISRAFEQAPSVSSDAFRQLQDAAQRAGCDAV